MALEVSPKESNFNIVQGDSFSIQIVYKDSTGSPVNLTGYLPYMEVRDKPGGKIVCLSASLNNGITIPTASAGIINVLITSDKTMNFTVPKAAYQLRIVSSSTATTLMHGWFIVDKGVME